MMNEKNSAMAGQVISRLNSNRIFSSIKVNYLRVHSSNPRGFRLCVCVSKAY